MRKPKSSSANGRSSSPPGKLPVKPREFGIESSKHPSRRCSSKRVHPTARPPERAARITNSSAKLLTISARHDHEPHRFRENEISGFQEWCKSACIIPKIGLPLREIRDEGISFKQPRLSKVLPVSARNTMKEASDQEPIRELYSRLNETGKF